MFFSVRVLREVLILIQVQVNLRDLRQPSVHSEHLFLSKGLSLWSTYILEFHQLDSIVNGALTGFPIIFWRLFGLFRNCGFLGDIWNRFHGFSVWGGSGGIVFGAGYSGGFSVGSVGDFGVRSSCV